MSHLRRWYFLVPLLFLLLAIAGLAADWWIALPEQIDRSYVGRQSCIECHAEEAKKWTGSHHDLAMDFATPDTVLGDFADRTFEHQGVTSRMFRRDADYCIETEGASGALETFTIKYTFGVDPLQQYLVEMPDGRVQCLSIAWDTKDKKWFHLYPEERIPHDDELHWTKPAQNWNHMCAECHSTDVHKNYDLKSNTFHTTFSEIDVSCEACHGPASVHVQLARSLSPFWDRRHGYGLARLKNKSSKTQLEACAKCHARRRNVHDGFQPGHEFLDYYEPELLDGNLYHADGQIRDEVYEYGSFLQSLMYRKGVRCTDCHDPHSARLRATGNQLCVRCHTSGKYDTPAHHHHLAGSAGASCVECHMPETTYMVVDPRRDHSIRVPRPDLSVLLGTPNACNKDCHQQKTPQWASDQIISWYGPKRRDDPHYAPTIAAARSRQLEPNTPGPQSAPRDVQREERQIVERLAALAQRNDVGPPVRATAVTLLGSYNVPRSLEAARLALRAAEPQVRAAGVRTVDALFGLRAIDVQTLPMMPPDSAMRLDRSLREFQQILAPLLNDSVRLVRTEAARYLSVVPEERLTVHELHALHAALEEFQAGQNSLADQPGAHANLAVLLENQGRLEEAEAAYHTALRLDPHYSMALNNLAVLSSRMGKSTQAEQLLRQLTQREPEFAQGHYQLGILLAEQPQRMSQAAESLERAVKLSPNNSRMRYNLGLAQQHLGRLKEAEASLLAAWQFLPNSFEYLNALTLLYAEQKQWKQALVCAKELARLHPEQQSAQLLLQQVQSAAGAE